MVSCPRENTAGWRARRSGHNVFTVTFRNDEPAGCTPEGLKTGSGLGHLRASFLEAMGEEMSMTKNPRTAPLAAVKPEQKDSAPSENDLVLQNLHSIKLNNNARSLVGKVNFSRN